jgi:secreted trypsin-like serine protease
MKILIVASFLLAASLSAEAKIQSRVTGGFSARSGLVKCYVSMIIEGESIGERTCSGCLIPRSGKFVGDRILTSAGCLFNAAEGKAVTVKFYLGLSGPAGSVVSARIKDIYKNVEFNPAANYSGADIAQIVLEQPFSQSFYGMEPAFPSNQDALNAYVGEKLFVCGHGNIDNNRTKPGFRGLQCTYLRAVPVDECAAAMPTGERLPKGIICTKNEDSSNVCGGDRGAPVFSNKTGQLQLVGIVSFYPDGRSNARCEDGHAVAITQVGYHNDFVKDPTFIPAAALATTAAPASGK